MARHGGLGELGDLGELVRWFERPHIVWERENDGPWRFDGWWFLAFGRFFRVRGWRLYRWRDG